MRGERPQREAEVLVDVERACGVLLVVGLVLGFVGRAVQDAAVDQKLAPLIVAVAGEQRVVEVEKGETAQNRRWTPMRKSCSRRSPVGSRDWLSALTAQSGENQ
jgi:hypothetical protein